MPSIEQCRRSRGALVATFTALAFTVCGCGSSSSGGGAIASHSDVLNIAYSGGWSSLDPAVAYASEPDVLSQIYDTLTSYTPAPGATAQPDLATSWSATDGARVWTFHLRHGVRFQDGEPFTSTAVKLSIERLLHLRQGAYYVFTPITAIDTPNPTTVVFHLSAPRSLDLMLAAGYGAYILSPKTASHSSQWFQSGRGYGTGPYMWKSYTPDQTAVLTRFNGYWGGWHANQVKTVVYNITPEPTTRVADVLSGTDQMADNPPTQDIPSLEKRSGFAVHELNITGGNYLQFNTKVAPLTDPTVRRAVLETFPTQEVITSVYNGTCTANASLIPVGIEGHTSGAARPSYDLASAKRLLAQSGHPNGGFAITFFFIPGIYPEQSQLAQLWKASLAKVGITLNIREVSVNVAQALATKANAGSGPTASVAFFPPNYPSASEYLAIFDTAVGGDYYPFYSNPVLTALINHGLSLAVGDPAASNAAYAQAERLIFDEGLGMNLCDKALPVLSASSVTGFTVKAETFSIYALRMG